MRQKQAIRVMMSGVNVFLTGAPGAGKTYVLNDFVGRAIRAGKSVAVTASTGIAATHLGGTTIHSWSGLGIRDRLTDEDRRWLIGNDRLIKRYNSVDVLVIDEVSMLHGSRLAMVDEAAKLLRKNEAPFGGLQVILVGDLFQLPPINRANEAPDFVHLSEVWRELDLHICYITEQHRQAGNDELLELLQAMRHGELEVIHTELIQARIDKTPPIDQPVTRLYTHNIDVESINQRQLAGLSGDSKTFSMNSKGNKARVEQLIKSVLAPELLELKIGAEVMFVANNFSEGYVNGSRGRIINFSGNTPVVELRDGKIIRVEPHSWSITEDGRVRAEVVQLPLRLAWAITIHKSQGMSLDAAEIDLSHAFTPGMGYVALSRVRSLNGLYLKGINRMALMMHPQIHEFDIWLRQASSSLESHTADISEEAVSTTRSTAGTVDTILLEKLKQWRSERAQLDKVAPYMVAHNAALEAIASKPPRSLLQLLALPGFGERKVESYGANILAVVEEYVNS